MPQDIYEEALHGSSAGRRATDDIYERALRETSADDETKLRATLQQARKKTPEVAARVNALSEQLGLPTSVIERNLDAMEARAQIENTATSRIIRQAPRLARFVTEKPDAAAVLQNDLPQLEQLERRLTFLDSIKRGVDVTHGMLFGAVEATGELVGSDYTTQLGRSGRKQVERAIGSGAPRSSFTEIRDFAGFAQWAKETIGEQIPIMTPMIAGGAAGAAAGSLVGPAGTVIGGLVGAFLPGFAMGVGEVQGGIKSRGDDAVAPSAAFIGGTAVAALDTVLPGKLGGRLVRVFGLEAAEEVAKRVLLTPVKRSALVTVAKGTVAGMATEGVTEALQEAIGEVAAARGTDTPIDPQLWRQMVEAGAAGALFGGAVTAAERAAEIPLERRSRQAAEALHKAGVLATMGTELAGVKGAELSPAAVETFLQEITKDGPAGRVYWPADTFVEYWKGKGQDPAAIAETLTGDANALERITRTGEDLEIPMSRYAAVIGPTEHNAFAAQEVRFEPGVMNAREAAEFSQQLAATQQAATAEPATSEAAEVRANIVEQLERGGMPRETAEQYAELYEATFSTMGARAGVNPLELFNRYGLKVDRVGITPTTGEAAAASTPGPAAPITAADIEALDRRKTTGEAPGGAERRRDPAAFPGEGAGDFNPEKVLEDLRARGIIGAEDPDAPMDFSNVGTAVARMMAEDPTFKARLADFTQRARNVTRANKGPRDVDSAPAAGETVTDDTGTEGARPQPGRGRRPTIRRIEESTPLTSRESALQRESRRKKHYAAVFNAVRDAAKELDPDVDVKALRKEFNDRVELVEELDQDWRNSGHNPRTVLQAIAAAGGISIDFETKTGGLGGELRWVKESSAFGPFGSFGGVRGVFQSHTAGRAGQRRSGLSLDDMTRALNSQKGFEWIEDINDLFAVLEDVARLTDPLPKTVNFPGTEELRRRAGIDPARDWWKPADEQTFTQIDPVARKAELEQLATDEAMGVDFDGPEGSTFPDGSAAIVCTNCAERMIELAGNGDVYGWEEGTNPTSVVAGPEQGAHTEDGQGHDFAVIDGRFLVDAWAKNVEGSAPRAVFDMLDETDRAEIARLYGDPSSWKKRVEKPGGRFEWVSEIPPALTETIDTLDTGEQQPRLPGAGQVRDQEIATPELEAPFSLTSPVSKARGKQTTLFQGAWHGSPHQFEKFSLHAMGSGEGNQAFGWGLYFASMREVAEGYRERLTGSKDWTVSTGGRVPNWVAGRLAPGLTKDQRDTILDSLLEDFRGRKAQAEENVAAQVGQWWNDQANVTGLQQIIDGLENLKAGGELVQPGRLFKVELPEDEDFLAWDLPASQQSPKVQAALRELGIKWVEPQYPTLEEAIEHLERRLGAFNPEGWGSIGTEAGDLLLDGLTLARSGNDVAFRRWYDRNAKFANFPEGLNPTGQEIYIDLQARALREPIGHGPEANVSAAAQRASEQLAAQGLAGIRYFDGFSRGAAQGSSNYVVFDDSLVEITEFFQLEGFYSRLVKAVEAVKQDKATGAQWKAMILNAKTGINKDEFALANVDDLEDGKSYTKEEVLQYLELNEVNVEEVRLSGPSVSDDEIRDKAFELMDARIDSELEDYEPDVDYWPETGARDNGGENGWSALLDGEDFDPYTVYDTEEEALRAAEDERQTRHDAEVDSARESQEEWLREKYSSDDFMEEAREALGVGEEDRTRYAEYVEDGAVTPGEDPTYREVFLTAPKLPPRPRSKRRLVVVDRVLAVSFGEGVQPITNTQGETRWDVFIGGDNPNLSDADRDRPFMRVWARDEAHAREQGQEQVDVMNRRQEHSDTHWEDGHDEYDFIDNPIVRIRLNERETAGLEGKPAQRVLFIEEVQPPSKREQKKMPELFTSNWRELGFKWALQYAVEIGAEVVAWTTGEMQQKRYNLARTVETIQFGTETRVFQGEAFEVKNISIGLKGDAGTRPNYVQITVKADGADRGKMFKVDGTERMREELEGKQLEEAIGPELAEQILAEQTGEISGEGLKVGGKGLGRLYDVDFRNVVNKLPAVRKMGGTVSTVDIAFGETVKAFPSETPGVPSTVRRVPNVQTVPALVITPELRASIEANGQALFQDPTDMPGARGSISFGADRQMNIRLFANANLSTFLHESGHFFLELFGDLADGIRSSEQRTPEQARMMADYNAVLAFLEVDNRQAIGRPQHEKFARAFEAYLMEGKAPSLSLRSAFARFRAWLVGVYRSMRGLNVALSPEIRDVFDRMLASDQAIADAEAEAQIAPLFTTPEAAGMRPEQFALYTAHVAEASLRARELLERRLLAEVQREQEKEWKRRRAEIEADVKADVYNRPVYLALAALQRGTYPDGTPLGSEDAEPVPVKISRASIVREFGEARLRTLPRPYVYTREGGIDVGTAAEMFGFSSADELLTALAQAPKMADIVEQMTDERMIAEQGSILLDGTLQEKAAAALGNEEREAVIRAELRALAELKRTVGPHVRQAVAGERRERAYERRWFEAEHKLEMAKQRGALQAEIDELQNEVDNLKRKAAGGPATIRAAIPPAEFIRERAVERIRATQIRNLRPALFWSAARKASQQATEAAARQDFDAAILAKQQELLNLALFRAANQALDDVDARVKAARALTKPAARRPIGLAGKSYLEQIDGILSRYEFADVSEKQLERRASLAKWVASLEGEGLPVELPEELLDETRRANYTELSYEELLGVTDGLQHIVHLARVKNRLLKSKDARELNAVAADIATSIKEKTKRRRKREIPTRTPAEERGRMLEGFFASHRKMSSLARELDGFEDGGPLWEAVIRPLNEAGDREAEMTAHATRELGKLIKDSYPGKELGQLYEKRHIPEIGQSLAKMNAIMVGLNWGNAGNRQRLQSGHKWTDRQVQAILDTLDGRDWTFIQGVWDFLESYWPEIAAKQERVFGTAPAKVEATPFDTPYGRMRGGYFPLKGDDRLSARTGSLLDLEAANIAKAAAYVSATTKRGHTKERVEKASYPVRLDFGVIFEHVNQVIHDLSHHEALLDVGRVLGHKRVQDAIYETHGDLVYRQFKDGVRDVAFGDRPAVNGFERAINHLRQGATVVGIGWNLATSLLQPIGLTQSAVRIGPKWVGRGIKRWTRDAFHMENSVRMITEKSTFMRNRFRTQQREINEIRNTLGVSTGKFGGYVDEVLKRTTFDTVTRQGIADSFFWMIAVSQRVADVPTWLGAYEKALETGAAKTDADAIAIADQAVLDSQAGGQVKDLASVQRGGPMFRLWTNFYSFFSTTYNLAAEARRRRNLKNPAEVGRMASDYLMLFILPASLAYMLRAAMGDRDDEDPIEGLIRANISYAMGTLLGVRELSGAVSGFDYSGPAGSRFFSTATRLYKQAEQGELDDAFFAALNEAAGLVFHYPAGQVRRTLEGVSAIIDGRTQNPGAIVTGAPEE